MCPTPMTTKISIWYVPFLHLEVYVCFTHLFIHSVPERIWIKGSYPSHRVKGDPLRTQNHDELKSSTVGPNLPYKFWKSKIFKNFRITLKFFFALQYIKNWTKVVSWKKIFYSWKKIFLVWKKLWKKIC